MGVPRLRPRQLHQCAAFAGNRCLKFLRQLVAAGICSEVWYRKVELYARSKPSTDCSHGFLPMPSRAAVPPSARCRRDLLLLHARAAGSQGDPADQRLLAPGRLLLRPGRPGGDEGSGACGARGVGRHQGARRDWTRDVGGLRCPRAPLGCREGFLGPAVLRGEAECRKHAATAGKDPQPGRLLLQHQRASEVSNAGLALRTPHLRGNRTSALVRDAVGNERGLEHVQGQHALRCQQLPGSAFASSGFRTSGGMNLKHSRGQCIRQPTSHEAMPQ